MTESVQAIRWEGDRLLLLDQRLLPHEVRIIECRTAPEVAEAIRAMIVRGAPAIGVCAAFGLALEARTSQSIAEISARIATAEPLLRDSRPTAVNLGWALDRMLRRWRSIEKTEDSSFADAQRTFVAEAEAIREEDLAGNRRIGQLGNTLLGPSPTILTHCNAGALATSGYGTALGVIRAAHEAGKRVAVFAGETRPYLQGARLTAWELMQDGIDVTLITDGMSGYFFQRNTFDAVIVGADRIAANGDAANKIGTYPLAVLAKAHSVPFYVAAPVSTIDRDCPSGDAIPIEERSHEEFTTTHGWDAQGSPHTIRVAPAGVAVRHPAFDVTPAALITAIITERGILRPPFAESIAGVVQPAGS